jgi:hypothetical protein
MVEPIADPVLNIASPYLTRFPARNHEDLLRLREVFLVDL